jgi:dihydrolipoamide dehydrogenase
MDFDVAVIGGGPGGYVCAVRASQLGLKTILFEKEQLGGTCLNRGCIPTKSLLHAAYIRNLIQNSEAFGIEAVFKSLNLKKVIDRTRSVVSGLNKGVSDLIESCNIKLINSEAHFKNNNTLITGSAGEFTAKNIVIATGAVPRILPDVDKCLMEKELIWTYKEAIQPKFIPKKLLIIGSGAIGVEFASFYNAMGSDVTIVEIQNRILTLEDEEISHAAMKEFSKQGINVRTGVRSQNFKEDNGKVSICIEGVVEIFDIVIMAVGVVPNIKSLKLENAGIEILPNNTIKVSDFQETNQKGIYAIGDVTNTPWLAHKASREGIIAAEHIAGLDEVMPINRETIPSCVYSHPQIASIGLTEEKAKELKVDLKIGKAYFKGNGKANAVGEVQGFVKLIFDGKTGEILGAHMIGHEVTELIPIISIAMAGELTEKELMATIFPHPTISEVIQEAVYTAFKT